MTDCTHDWLIVPGGDVSVTKARELGVKLPEHIKEEGLKYAVFVRGYTICTVCGFIAAGRMPRARPQH